MTELIVPHRYCGPPTTGNGGWTAGALAELIDPEAVRLTGPPDADRRRGTATIEVSLRQPPPLDAAMQVSTVDATTSATFGGSLVATAREAFEPLLEVDPVSREAAHLATAAFPGLKAHPFATCFVCGTDRGTDGLRIFPGPVPDTGGGTPAVFAATWTPQPNVAAVDVDPAALGGAPVASVPATWAALDCIGGWAGGFGEVTMVLGRMTARLDTLPVIGEELIVVGECRRREGRKAFTATTLYDSDTRVVATAEQIWITIDGGAPPASVPPTAVHQPGGPTGDTTGANR